MQKQKIEFYDEFSIILTKFPINAVDNSFPIPILIGIYFTSLIGVLTLGFIFETSDLEQYILISGCFSLVYLLLAIILSRGKLITIHKDKTKLSCLLARVIPIKLWDEPISSYSAIIGKRYYSKFGGKKPLLVREVILHNQKNPLKCNIILARFIDRSSNQGYINQELWTEYWYNACLIFNKPPIDLVDKQIRKIDTAQIKFISGDGGAIHL